MIRKTTIFYFICLLLHWSQSIAQKDSDYDPKKEIAYDGKRYRVHNNYLTIGAGKAHSSSTSSIQFNGAADFNFHIQKNRFQIGAMLNGNHFGSYNHFQAHLCFGKRFEQNKYNIAGYLGGSYSSINKSYEDSVVHINIVKRPGFYACVQTTYKFKYDLGIGLCFFADFNSAQSLYGLRLELFFSGSYRRAIRGQQNLNQQPETYR